MNDQLELKHLAPYLPYGLKIKENSGLKRVLTLKWLRYREDDGRPIVGVGINSMEINMYHEEFKPILRPLSDLTKEIEYNGEGELTYFDVLEGGAVYISWCESKESGKPISINQINGWPWRQMVKLFEWHFDVFGLIEKGLAIDINTLDT